MDSPLRRALTALANRQSLSEEQTAEVFAVVMSGDATPAQIGGLLMGLRAKGETADELAGAARALRHAMVRVNAAHQHLVDTCGTGGGSEPERAPIGAEALVRLGAEHALVVHGRVGMDEISPHGVTDVWEVKDGAVRSWEIDPERFRLGIKDVGHLQGGEPAANAERLERILGNGAAGNEPDPAGLAAVLLNAGAALYVAGVAAALAEGIGRAREVGASGAARASLDRLRKATASISG